MLPDLVNSLIFRRLRVKYTYYTRHTKINAVLYATFCIKSGVSLADHLVFTDIGVNAQRMSKPWTQSGTAHCQRLCPLMEHWSRCTTNTLADFLQRLKKKKKFLPLSLWMNAKIDKRYRGTCSLVSPCKCGLTNWILFIISAPHTPTRMEDNAILSPFQHSNTQS